MNQGTIGKRCSCTDPHTGRRLGAGCPQLHRGHNGSWSSSHGVWWLQIELPVASGAPRRQFRRSGYPSRQAALDALDKVRALLALAPNDHDTTLRIGHLLASLPARQPIPTPQAVAKHLRVGQLDGVTITLADYLDDWLAGRNGLSPTTIRSYAQHITNQLKPHLGHLGLDSLRPVHIQDMFAAIEARNTQITAAKTSPDPAVRTRARGMRRTGNATQQRIRATLRKALNDAISIYQLIDYNPAVPIQLPSGARPRARAWTPQAVKAWRATGTRPSAVMVWQPAQARQFLDHAAIHDPAGHPLYALITVWGLRRGEACGLRDTDVDLDTATLTICQQRTAVNYQPIVKTVKSDAGDRVLHLDDHTVAILRRYLATRTRWQLSAPHWPDTGFFFLRPDGQPWHPDALTARFQRAVRDAGLPPIRLHDLRHCAASYLKLAGADLKTIQTILGHSSIVITADTYTLLFADQDRTATQQAANIIHGNTPARPTKTA